MKLIFDRTEPLGATLAFVLAFLLLGSAVSLLLAFTRIA